MHALTLVSGPTHHAAHTLAYPLPRPHPETLDHTMLAEKYLTAAWALPPMLRAGRVTSSDREAKSGVGGHDFGAGGAVYRLVGMAQDDGPIIREQPRGIVPRQQICAAGGRCSSVSR